MKISYLVRSYMESVCQLPKLLQVLEYNFRSGYKKELKYVIVYQKQRYNQQKYNIYFH